MGKRVLFIENSNSTTAVPTVHIRETRELGKGSPKTRDHALPTQNIITAGSFTTTTLRCLSLLQKLVPKKWGMTVRSVVQPLAIILETPGFAEGAENPCLKTSRMMRFGDVSRRLAEEKRGKQQYLSPSRL